MTSKTKMEEYWDIYDKNRKLQNKTIRRGDPFGDGEYYVCCEVWIVNSKGEMLVTKRHPNKKAGGLWEFIGGGVLAGETTAQAAIREVEEETGIVISADELSLLYTYEHKNYFMDIFLVKKDVNINNIVLDKNETVDARWANKKELLNMIENQQVVRSVAMRFGMLNDKI